MESVPTLFVMLLAAPRPHFQMFKPQRLTCFENSSRDANASFIMNA